MHHLGIVSEDGSHKTATVYDAIQIKPKSVIRKSFFTGMKTKCTMWG